MQVPDHPGREPHAAEDDVLDAGLQVALAARGDLRGALADQPEHHRDVVGAEAPERVLVGADDAQVLPVAVEVEDLAERALVHEVLQLLHGGVVDEQVVDHQHPAARVGQLGQRVRVGRGQRQWLLDEGVLAGLERQRARAAWVGTGVAMTTASRVSSPSRSS